MEEKTAVKMAREEIRKERKEKTTRERKTGVKTVLTQQEAERHQISKSEMIQAKTKVTKKTDR